MRVTSFPVTVRSLVFLHTLLILLFFYSGSATACMFFMGIQDAKSLKRSDIVFAGKLARCFSEKDNHYLEFEVHRIWKGPIRKIYTSQTDQCSADTPYDNMGREVVVFANKIKESSHIDIPYHPCSLTTRPLVPFERRYLFGFALPDMFIYEGVPDDLSELGNPIYTTE